MKAAWAYVQDLIAKGAVHRKGFVVGKVPEEQMIRHAHTELEELRRSPNDMDELADTMGILIHYAITKGWTPEQVEAAMIAKWRERFTIPGSSLDGSTFD